MTIFQLVMAFFRTYLVNEKGLNKNTVASYAEAVKQLLKFAAEKMKTDVHKLDLAMFNDDLVREFLDDLQARTSIATRNQRLAAIRVFFTYLGRHDPTMIAAAEAITSIANKKDNPSPVESLSQGDVHAFIDLAKNQSNPLKRTRDIALFTLLYNTGARASEIVGLNVEHLHRGATPIITVTGKGGKTRAIPLWTETVEAVNAYLECRDKMHINANALFLNPQRQRLSRFGLRHIVRQYAGRLAQNRPSMANRSVTPHTFRHTTAFHLLRANNDLVTVKDWLGHSDINTTSQYCTIDPHTKRQALSTFRPADANIPVCKWQDPDVLTFLTDLASTA